MYVHVVETHLWWTINLKTVFDFTHQTFRPIGLTHRNQDCLSHHIWTASSEFGTYRICEQRRFRRAIRAVSQEPPPLAHISNESRGTFRQKARSLASLNGWACAVKICHDEMLKYLHADRTTVCFEPWWKLRARLGSRKTGLSPPVFLYWPFQGGTTVVVPYCYLFLLSVFIRWFNYYVSGIFCKF